MKYSKIMISSILLSFLWLVTTVTIGGMTYPDYNHFSQFISELGAKGAPYVSMVNYLGFVPTEIFMLIFIATVFSALPRTKLALTGLFFLTLYALALIMAAIYVCDFECRPIHASTSHNLHLVFGMSAYLFAAIGVLLLSIDSKKWRNSKVVHLSGWGIGIAVIILVFNLDPDSSVVGLLQRITESLLYLWFFLLALYLYKPMADKRKNQN